MYAYEYTFVKKKNTHILLDERRYVYNRTYVLNDKYVY